MEIMDIVNKTSLDVPSNFLSGLRYSVMITLVLDKELLLL